MSSRTVEIYLVLERKSGWGGKARVVAHSVAVPGLKRGQCAVKIALEVPDAAFEPVLAAPKQVVTIDDTLRAELKVVPNA